MRLLAVHADRVAYEAVQPAGPGNAENPAGLGDAESPATAPTAGELGECVVAFVGVEREDRADIDAAAKAAATEIDAIADKLGTDAIAVLPKEGLLDDPAPAAVAAAALAAVESALDGDRELLRAPVGWRLAIECKRKGHPFAEQSRRVVPQRGDGRGRHGDAETVDALSTLGLATADPATNERVVRWHPRGQFLRTAIERHAAKVLADAGAATVSTPDIGVHAAADRRGDVSAADRQDDAAVTDAIVGPADDDQLLRPGLHGGVLSSLADADGGPSEFSETVRWSPAVAANVGPEPFGQRVRPEYHGRFPDEAGAIESFQTLAGVAADATAALDSTASGELQLTESFEREHPQFADQLDAGLDGEVRVETVPDDARYWAARLSFVAAREDGRDRQFGSVELDTATPTRFGIEAEVNEEPPVLVHAAPVGDVEGTIAALAVRATASERVGLPVWLAPTQVRLVPIDDRHVGVCEDAADELRSADVRADIDAREATVGERLDRADRERVPYVAVAGDREAGGETLPVRVLETGREERVSVGALAERVLADSGGRRASARPVPERVDRR
ncbi:Anticodon binding domain-containing protein [Natronoarchaeum philippinense]|uniref:Anticodon binding domain-containing protein n=1 Tax=Natronoarchaeum philippinense TaxID=558529 RepID=A0A285P8Q0_NATPI|nr:threonyl-tRNA synthetase editing domain-containing protein [Natronoarchaeum philippinense]SNZ18115.1 Anticodon binding domain-containing protein [Natronoarchaeum philippinense]